MPAIFFTLCRSRAPYACPISTLLPLDTPKTNEKSKKMIGNTAEIAPRACVEIRRPIQMLAIVCDADCKTLLSMSGTRKTRRICHIGFPSSKMFTP